MRTRLLLVLAVLAALTTATFAVPLALATAESRTREFVLSRDADLQRFAGLAEDYLLSGAPGTLDEELEAYAGLYGEGVAVSSTRGAAPRSVGLDLDSPPVRDANSRAVRNEPPPTPPLITPWSPETVLFAQPVGTDAQVSGVVVLEASTADAKTDIVRSWLTILAVAVAAMLVFGLIAQGISGWILRPLNRLSGRVRELTAGLPFVPRAGGAPQQSLPGGGPPELRALTGSFDAMSTAVTASAEAQRRLVADTAHQLRNPLTALQLRLDVLESKVPEPDRPAVGQAAAEADRLNAILSDLLSLARAEIPAAGRGGTCDAAAIAAERTDFWALTARSAGTSIELGIPAGPAPASVPVRALEQLLDVLLDNACKYAAGARIEVGVRTTEDGGAVVVTVADHGPGVAPENMDRLTERFFRGGHSADRGGTGSWGTGLGLAIAAALAENAGAQLAFTETSGGGLTATLRLRSAAGVADAGMADDGVADDGAADDRAALPGERSLP